MKLILTPEKCFNFDLFGHPEMNKSTYLQQMQFFIHLFFISIPNISEAKAPKNKELKKGNRGEQKQKESRKITANGRRPEKRQRRPEDRETRQN